MRACLRQSFKQNWAHSPSDHCWFSRGKPSPSEFTFLWSVLLCVDNWAASASRGRSSKALMLKSDAIYLVRDPLEFSAMLSPCFLSKLFLFLNFTVVLEIPCCEGMYVFISMCYAYYISRFPPRWVARHWIFC